ncbi:MAG: helix-turn-helix transcriptional regulator [Dehalococcoidia bacterium]|nr:helix-turn-helix transcriptional regulator [Dehalococcoidia bacterium]
MTRSEQRVLELLSHGYTNREIAGTLVCSAETVKTHVAHILQKLGVGSRHEAGRTSEKRSPVTGDTDYQNDAE